ncbi:MAG: DNA helicase RecQ [Verrucomicrobiota bacterium]
MKQQLHETLKQSFGFTAFRPLQEEIVLDALEGRDVFALLPTGGGKSLCFQLPALMKPGLTVVVSPLISLMKDQVDALQESGIAATFLNSALAAGEGRKRLRGLHLGEYKLLYAAPERLMLSGMLEDLKQWNVNLIAIDEAHCISEWGHDFRPEYRQLSSLRDHFPGVPIMALTATATERVREDIARQLRLDDSRTYVASFNRPNLTYRVIAKSKPYDQVREFVRSRRNESGIVYCFSRKSAESVAERLTEDGIKALPYHAGLTAKERERNQELFLRDEVRVIAATIAFGMGINKPNVRYVVHYDLPKNIEGYYQETGRAGRDGLPSECLLLFSAADVVKQNGFIDEKPTLQEQQIAREQLQKMVHYAESSDCRRVTLLRYFGEEWPEESCGGCDNCLTPRETIDGTLVAQKFLSCVYRVRQKSEHGFGLNHLIEVLTGAETDMVRKWRHNELSTYGIGKELKRAEWQAVGRELIRLGYLRQTSEKFSVIELTPEGREVLTQRKKVLLTKTVEPKPQTARRSGDIPCDEQLFERLRALRRRIADEHDVAAYIIFSDVALREMANRYPANREEFARISGVGKQKLDAYAEPFIDEIAAYLRTYPKQIFEDSFTIPTPPLRKQARSKTGLSDTIRETLRLLRSGMSLEEIAQNRGFVSGTIYGHLASAVENGEALRMEEFFSEEDQRLISTALEKSTGSLATAKELLGGKFEYGPLRLYCALIARK